MLSLFFNSKIKNLHQFSEETNLQKWALNHVDPCSPINKLTVTLKYNQKLIIHLLDEWELENN